MSESTNYSYKSIFSTVGSILDTVNKNSNNSIINPFTILIPDEYSDKYGDRYTSKGPKLIEYEPSRDDHKIKKMKNIIIESPTSSSRSSQSIFTIKNKDTRNMRNMREGKDLKEYKQNYSVVSSYDENKDIKEGLKLVNNLMEKDTTTLMIIMIIIVAIVFMFVILKKK